MCVAASCSERKKSLANAPAVAESILAVLSADA